MRDDGSCDTSIIESVIREISETTNKKKLIVIKSTVPPGTTQKLQNKHQNFDFCFNPEFLTQANFINDFIKQDRILLGWTTDEIGKRHQLLINLYDHFLKEREDLMPRITRENTFFWAGPSEIAEMAKYVGNSFLTTKVVFFNEMYQICKNAGIDYDKVVKLVSQDRRIGASHMKVPGPDGQFGAGGPCFPKDTNALIAFAKQNNVDPLVLESIWSKNLLIREVHEWESLAQVNGKYKKDE